MKFGLLLHPPPLSLLVVKVGICSIQFRVKLCNCILLDSVSTLGLCDVFVICYIRVVRSLLWP